MAHLHTLTIRPQIYVDLLEGDDKHPYYIYVGATEDYPKRYTQKVQSYDAYHSGDNDGWSTPEFCRKLHKVRKCVSLQFVDGGRACAQAEMNTFMKLFHIHDCDMDRVRGADWCRPELSWESCKWHGPTLRQAYDEWAKSHAEEANRHRGGYLAYIQTLL